MKSHTMAPNMLLTSSDYTLCILEMTPPLPFMYRIVPRKGVAECVGIIGIAF